MAQGRGVIQTQLKRDLNQLGHNLLNINLQIQAIKKGQQ